MHSAANQSHTLCILSVPATMTCHDLMNFTAACHQDIQYFRIIRDENPNQYMTLITFRSSVRNAKSIYLAHKFVSESKNENMYFAECSQ